MKLALGQVSTDKVSGYQGGSTCLPLTPTLSPLHLYTVECMHATDGCSYDSAYVVLIVLFEIVHYRVSQELCVTVVTII